MLTTVVWSIFPFSRRCVGRGNKFVCYHVFCGTERPGADLFVTVAEAKAVPANRIHVELGRWRFACFNARYSKSVLSTCTGSSSACTMNIDGVVSCTFNVMV